MNLAGSTFTLKRIFEISSHHHSQIKSTMHALFTFMAECQKLRLNTKMKMRMKLFAFEVQVQTKLFNNA